MADIIDTSMAMRIAEQYGWKGIARITIIDWCGKYGIGVKIAGRWKINKLTLIKLLTGQLEEQELDEESQES
jgi:hypothetical protein